MDKKRLSYLMQDLEEDILLQYQYGEKYET